MPSSISRSDFSALKRRAWSPILLATKPLSSLKWTTSNQRSTPSDQAESSTPSRIRPATDRRGPFSMTPRGTTSSCFRNSLRDRQRKPKEKLFHTVGEQQNGCMISAVLEPKRRFPLRFCRSRRKGAALNNLAGALHIEGAGCTLPVGREVKMEIPA